MGNAGAETRLNPVPLADRAETLIVLLLVALLLSVKELVLLEPTATLPKAMDETETDSCPATMPLPVSGMLIVEFAASEVTVSVPLVAPADVGENVTVALTLCPGDNVNGTAGLEV